MSLSPCRRLLCCTTLWLIAHGVQAQDAAPARPAGHSVHGEAFNEGPRQKARLMGGTGKVYLEITTKSPDAKAFFEQGLGQLHGFWYYEAERSFRQAAMLDPDCAMAYWGLAMANANNEARAKKFIAEAVTRKDKVSPREQRYIMALSDYYTDEKAQKKEKQKKYIKSLEHLLYDYPNELEAKALLALALWIGRDEEGLSLTSYLAVDALLGEVFAVEPMHPAHHYRIHLWDYEKADKAVPSAARSGQAAPHIAHMWHMGGHIFSDLHRYHDAVWQQEASSRVDHAYMIQDWILPDQIHNFAHNQEWMIRNLDHIGRVKDAVRLAKNSIELPRHPRFNPGRGRGSSYLGKQRLFDVLEDYELWAELSSLVQSAYLETPTERWDRAEYARWLALAAYHQNDFTAGEHWLAKLTEEVQQADREIAALKSPQEGNDDHPASALFPEKGPHLQKRKDLEDQRHKLEQLAAELRGVRAYQRQEFAVAWQELKKGDAGKIQPFFQARVQWLAGEKDEALKKTRETLNNSKNQVRAMASAADNLWLAGLKDEAKGALEKLRALSGDLELDAPVFARLAPIMQELGWLGDWRVKSSPAPDTGERPPLESLGPYTWSPPVARSWNAIDPQAVMHSSAEFAGKPTIVIYYLGHRCLHCTQQLTAFADRQADFEKQGLQLVGIGTDDAEGLKVSIQNYAPKAFPFPLFSDASFAAFKEFRCFDDFENQPLHGTFLIDAQGRLRWWDIGHEPFMDVDFVLKESARLLKLPGT